MPKTRTSRDDKPDAGINRITVCGYKSVSHEQSIDIRPLTILAGANSSGKSSMMQPLLLLKQTLEASYDSDPLLLRGPNLKFTAWDQLMSRRCAANGSPMLMIGVGANGVGTLTTSYRRVSNKNLAISEMTYLSEDGTERTVLRLKLSQREMAKVKRGLEQLREAVAKDLRRELEWTVVRNRCFLSLGLRSKDENGRGRLVLPPMSPADLIEPYIRGIIHLPGLRGNPERNYGVAAVGHTYLGTFETYAASIIAAWQSERQQDTLQELNHQLRRLGLTSGVEAKEIDATQVELRVGRLRSESDDSTPDMVSIADVGFGVSQVLPVLVALLVADPGQMVYIEQPEIHLHPRAQVALADLLAEAAERGVRVVAETHSSLILLRIQTLVAQGKLNPSLVALHWFERGEDGATQVVTADLDESGAFGDWPEDFGSVELDLESEYLGAASARLRGQ